MDHIHNEAVLAFLQTHKDNPNVQGFLAKQKRAIEALNREIGTGYKDYLDFKNMLKFFSNPEERDSLTTDAKHYSWNPPIDWDFPELHHLLPLDLRFHLLSKLKNNWKKRLTVTELVEFFS